MIPLGTSFLQCSPLTIWYWLFHLHYSYWQFYLVNLWKHRQWSCKITCQVILRNLLIVTLTVCTQPSPGWTRGRVPKGRFVGACLPCSDIHLSTIRTLTYFQGLTGGQCCAELSRCIHLISAHTGIMHTHAFQWGIELSNDDAQAQTQASVCKVIFCRQIFQIFELIEHVHGS